jgi:hypothetical protein
MNDGHIVHPTDERITIRQIVLDIKEYGLEVWKNKIWVLILIIIAALFLFINAYKKPTTYSAKVTFMLNEEQAGSGGISAILGSFGISGTNYNLLKISELSKSRRIITNAFFEKAVIKGKNDWLVNHIIREEKVHKKWKEKSKDLAGFFFTNNVVDSFSIKENKALIYLYRMIAGNPENGVEGLMTPDASDVTQINSISLKMQNDELAVAFTRSVFNALSVFYIEKSIEQKKEAYEMMRYKRDSIYRAMTGNDYSLARFNDRTLNPVRQTPIVPSAQMQRMTSIYSTAYAQALANTELAEYALAINTPFVQVIDLPILPLSKNSASPIRLAVISVLLGLFVGILFFCGRKFFRNAMKVDL